MERCRWCYFGNAGTWWSPDQIVAETPWRHKLVEGGGIALDLGVHLFDMIRYVGGEVKDVSARTAVVEPVRYTRGEDGGVLDQVECDADDSYYASFENGGRGEWFGLWQLGGAW